MFQAIAEYIDKLQENEDIFEQISENGRKAKKEKAKELSREQERLKHIQQKISVMEDKIPEAMLGEYPVPVDKLVDLIEKQKQENKRNLTERMSLLMSGIVCVCRFQHGRMYF